MILYAAINLTQTRADDVDGPARVSWAVWRVGTAYVDDVVLGASVTQGSVVVNDLKWPYGYKLGTQMVLESLNDMWFEHLIIEMQYDSAKKWAGGYWKASSRIGRFFVGISERYPLLPPMEEDGTGLTPLRHMSSTRLHIIHGQSDALKALEQNAGRGVVSAWEWPDRLVVGIPNDLSYALVDGADMSTRIEPMSLSRTD